MKKVFLFLIFFLFLSKSVLADFSDTADHMYLEDIQYAESNGIINGHPDGTFKPDNEINRAEFTKIIINSAYSEEEIDQCDASQLPFFDVDKKAWYAKYICLAYEREIVRGYDNGSFLPSRNISFVEAAKIMTLGLNLPIQESSDDTFWYSIYTNKLNENKAIPSTIFDIGENITRGEMVAIIHRLKEGYNGTDYNVVIHNCLVKHEPELEDLGFGYYRYGDTAILCNDLTNLIGVDVPSLKAFSETYITDMNGVYYVDLSSDTFTISNQKIPEADLESFIGLNNVYAKDKDHVYFYGKVLEGADPESFELAELISPEFESETSDRDKQMSHNYFNPISVYAKDKNQAYYKDQILTGIDPGTFKAYALTQYMGDDYLIYARNTGNIIYKGKVLNDVDAESWEMISYLYQKDINHIYCENKIVEGADLETFEVINDWDYAKDKNHFYYMNEVRY